MVTVTEITSPTEIASDGDYVLVMFGPENKQTRHSRGLNLIVSRDGMSDLLATVALSTQIDSAKAVAKREGFDTVYVCRT